MNKTIAKISGFVISLCLLAGAAGCGFVHSNGRERRQLQDQQSPYSEPVLRGRIESDDIKESSGLTASKCYANVFWTHNDSGNEPLIYAIDAQGKHLGTWKVAGAENRDWEDIASFRNESGECFLYIGEIGNNEQKRDRTMVYRIKEPAAAVETQRLRRKERFVSDKAESINVNYPGERPNAETLLVHPKTGDIYIVTKRVDGPAAVYRIASRFGSSVTAEKVGEASVPSVPNGLLTGGDISPDGRRVVICDYVAAYEWSLPAGVTEFEEIWKQKPVKFDIGERKNGEAVAFSVDGTSLFATSEGKNSPIFEVRKR